ncbi:DUF5074 domain-containing protein [uncultured Porphyromonas sp.]|uniref:DUF5074 domain-containing protein n=1 Tax=uncultured Porphyromonas sp. TaxID=159274 RepID=UPI002585AE66|nr:DUF5074 domain-containing protein [uncultured Porphyromonas sp.]
MKRLNLLLLTLLSSLALFSCISDSDKTPDSQKSKNDARVFVLNEGVYNKETGFLDVINAEGGYQSKVEKSNLGGTAQDLAFFSDYTYVIAKDPIEGTHKGRLVSLKTADYSIDKDYSELISDLEKPSNIAILDLQNIFIRDAKAIHRLDLVNGKLTKVEGTDGAIEMNMVALNNRVVAAIRTKDDEPDKGKKLVSINKNEDKVSKELTLDASIKGIAQACRRDVFVATADGNNAIYRINSDDLSIIKKNEITGTTGDALNAKYTRGVIAAKDDIIYYAGGGSVIYRHNFAKNETKAMADVASEGFYPEGTITYNSLGVHPRTGHVYITRIKDWSENDVNAILELDLSGDTGKLVKKYENKVAYPAGFYFPANR